MSTINGNTYAWNSATNTKTITVKDGSWDSRIDCNLGGVGPNPLTSTDTCYIICEDTGDAKMSELHCRSAGICEMKGNADHCWNNGIINGTGSQQFIWNTEYKTSENCEIHLPYQGNATIYANAKGDGVLKKTKLISHQTKFIDITIIDSSGTSDDYKDECKGLVIEASDAESLKLTLIDADYQTDNPPYRSTINCPENSNISPSCIIDATQAESVADLDIYALYGSPQNILYSGSDATDASSVVLHCLNGYTGSSSIIANTDSFSSGTCFITPSPSKSPTTISPSKSPSKMPSRSPSKSPSNNPSMTPSKSPSKIPSVSPSMYPSTSPSGKPSVSPSISPTYRPTVPSYVPTTGPTNEFKHGEVGGNTYMPSVAVITGINLVGSGGGGGLDSIGVIAVVLSLLVCCLCGFGIFGLWKYQSLRAEKDSEIIRMQSDMKHNKGHFMTMNSMSNSPYGMDDGIDGDGDGDRTTQTSPWMIPGTTDYREAAVSTIEMGGMSEGLHSNGDNAALIEEEETILKEGAGAKQSTGHMDITEDDNMILNDVNNITPNGDVRHDDEQDILHDVNAILTPNGDEQDDDDDVIGDAYGGIATPMGPDILGDIVVSEMNHGNDNDLLHEHENENDDYDHDNNNNMDGDIINDINHQIDKVIVDDMVTAGNDMDDMDDMDEEGSNEHDMDDMDDENDIIDADGITIMSDEDAMQRKQKKQEQQFGQILGDDVFAQDIVMDDIVNDMDNDELDDDEDELLQGIDTVQ